ncbi:DNA repair protein RAD16 [Trichophyton tonsurans CBS 112818]|uniref:DNA repair protein RAD16 n=1 Tax=Trichophyton tonsurans (strain CBS 112818) TaxID=647933 RepID=F2S0A1_TRIT1|nr:DNA repair protein RAD16 [Trichophyton tonsurans CBS 112818]
MAGSNAKSLLDKPLGQAATRRSSRVASASKGRDETATAREEEPERSMSMPKRQANIMVAIPVKKGSLGASASTSTSTTSTSASSSTAGQSPVGYSTPATTATATPNNEPESSSRASRRVNATARALELRNSSLSLNNRKRTANASSSSSRPNTIDDEKLAAALQAEEYNARPTAKKQKTTSGSSKAKFVISDSESDAESESESDSDSDSEEWFSTNEEAIKITPKKSFKRKPRNYRADSPADTDLDSVVGMVTDSMDSSQLSDISSIEDSEESDDLGPSDRYRRLERFIGATKLTRAQKERRKLETEHPQIIDMWERLEQKSILSPPPAAQPEGINRKLKPFQLQGLSWMLAQEKSEWKGGLLGDEMGMGKTIQAVSLLMSDYPVGKPSLVVVPPVALMQWQAEIESYTDGKLKVFVYHNANSKVKDVKAKELKTYDVIMVSYSGLESMYRKETKGWKRDGGLVKGTSMLHSIDFHRLILDEAHNIKQRTTSVAKACFALKSTYKWCLSGTPVQNRIGEFFSLLRFLEIKPFACYFCKSCSCEALHWTQDALKKCTLCNHSGFNHVSIFNQEILNPITENRGDDEKRKDALKKLRLLTDRIMLRRVKRDHTSSMELPPKRIDIHREFFGEIEQDFSRSIMTNTTRQFDRYVSRGVMLNNYANIFGLIMQMRQVANHPDLILKKHAEGGQNILVCCVCDEPAEEPIRSRCKHEFCRQCAKEYMASVQYGSEPDCPRCHLPLSIDFEQPDIEQDEGGVKKNSIINRIKMENWTSSTKIEMLVFDLCQLRNKKRTNKSIVFSQFTSMLQLVEWRLHRAGISTVMLDGSMSPVQRQRSIDYFMQNVDTEVFLVSLKAGGVALNLTEASRVFIVDPWWNPAAEWQSADRCHRIGQRRPCVITRLCIEDSVESRMVLLQEKKANMINGTINKDQSEALERLTPEDMQFLFRGN